MGVVGWRGRGGVKGVIDREKKKEKEQQSHNVTFHAVFGLLTHIIIYNVMVCHLPITHTSNLRSSRGDHVGEVERKESTGPDMYVVITLTVLPWLRLHGKSSSGKQMGWIMEEEEETEE